MDHGIWTKPVVFERYGYPGIITVTSTYEAARLLFGLYATRKTLCLRDALVACLSVINGLANPGMARYEFIDAIIASGFPVLPETFLSDPAPRNKDIADIDRGTTTRWLYPGNTRYPNDRNSPSAGELFRELLRVGAALTDICIDRTIAMMSLGLPTRSRMTIRNHSFPAAR